MTVRGTGLMKYRAGLVMEAQGCNAAAIARELGLKDAQAWYTLKWAQHKKLEALNQRAAEGAGEAAEQHWAAAQAPVKANEAQGQEGAARTEKAQATEIKEKVMQAQECTTQAGCGPINGATQSLPLVTADLPQAARLLKEECRTLSGSVCRYELEEEIVSITEIGFCPSLPRPNLRIKPDALGGLIGELQEVVRILGARIA